MTWVNLAEILYPVGCLYLTIDATSPSELFGGTWATFSGGMLCCAEPSGPNHYAAAGSNGGSRKITVNNLPAHTHPLWTARTGTETTTANNPLNYMVNGGTCTNPQTKISSRSTGEGVDYIPYHVSTYVWRRTA